MGLPTPRGNDFFDRVRAFMEFASHYGLEVEHPSNCLARFISQSFVGESRGTELMLEIKETSPEPVLQRAKELLSYLGSELRLAEPELKHLGAKTI